MLNVRILVKHQEIGSFAGATHREGFGSLESKVIVECSPCTIETLRTSLNDWRNDVFIVHEGKNLLFSNIIAVETQEEPSS